MKKCGELKFVTLILVLSIIIWLSVVLLMDGGLHFELKNDIGIAQEDDDNECVSRTELPLYRRRLGRKPSAYLVSKLRSYEARHKRCGPHTEAYNQTLQLLTSNSTNWDLDCKYVVWIPYNGLGNKMLSLASTFLYALLTDRVLLADRGADMPDLFCEPFPQVSWLLPLDFPLTTHFTTFNQLSNQSYGNRLKTNSSSTLQSSYLYLYLSHDYDRHDQLFFCDYHQTYLHSVPWLIVKADLYFLPSFFLMPSFQSQLQALFPEKETVFHFLGRYLFHPTNSVWGLVTRYYQTYLSKADVKVGIQVRVYDDNDPFKEDQILSCTRREKILPQISTNSTKISTTTTVAVVMASLRSNYSDRLRDMYWENPTEAGEVVGVFQPSHEEYQQTENANHERKALAEVYLLSLTDKLVTSGWSTFGYVAQGLGGLKPWIMYMPQNQQSVPDPPCGRALSMEPCSHYFPDFQLCKTRVNMSGVTRCEDRSWDFKLVY